MISYLEFPDGTPLELNADRLQQSVGELIVANAVDLQLLEVGVYDITPKIWTKNTHNHQLDVLDDGTGLYSLFPKDSGVGFMRSDTGMRIESGGTTNIINGENPLAVVAGGHKSKAKPQIFGIIAYLPID